MSIKLNLGCGGNVLAGFENHDIDMDITKPLPHKDGSVDFILAEHVVEHITGPEAFRFMKECYRVLCSGGTLRICVPELARLDRAKREDIIVNHGHLMVFNFDNLRDMLVTAGFINPRRVQRSTLDGHWKVIGEPLDTQETLRVEAVK
jgi:predicted SAM-dependent methyltransferase